MNNIRKATTNDITAIMRLLSQVHNVHANIRPDLFKKDETKYTENELEQILKDNSKPIFVYENENGVKGYIFCIIEDLTNSHFAIPHKSIYIDDLCIDENERGKGIAHLLFDFVKNYAKQNGFYNITLNVWEGNDNAKHFYENLGMRVQKTVMETIL